MPRSLLSIANITGPHAQGKVILIVICVAIGVYLLAALLWPEKF
ncbi:MAG TPA: K(+)-transporting ATPase subunit F [Candidatus Acidoferrum sp.]|nr:K(+)-transporting ATPase subunit F [Candidatus Acidoferrum sp.]